MTLELQPYLEQQLCWPASGRHILAQFDADSVVVYQAYSARIGEYATRYGRFGGEFSFGRMSWIKPNFLWMMYRSGWGEKDGQTHVLAIRVRRTLWDEILAGSVPSSFSAALYESPEAWKADIARSEVRLQWDPDHAPRGQALERRAVQLGLRGETLRRFATEALAIEDVSEFVRAQKRVVDGAPWSLLQTPRERVYPVNNPDAARRLGLAKLETEQAGSGDDL